jgi:dTMP kinase
VRNAYLDRARAEPGRIRVLDARHAVAKLQAEIGQILQGLT